MEIEFSFGLVSTGNELLATNPQVKRRPHSIDPRSANRWNVGGHPGVSMVADQLSFFRGKPEGSLVFRLESRNGAVELQRATFRGRVIR